jgi:hypothetical protein
LKVFILRFFIHDPKTLDIFQHTPRFPPVSKSSHEILLWAFQVWHFIFGKVIGKKAAFYTGVTDTVAITAKPHVTCPVKIQRYNIIAANAEGIQFIIPVVCDKFIGAGVKYVDACRSTPQP